MTDKVGIFGLGITGQSIYKELKTKLNRIYCWDDSEINRNNFSKQFDSSCLVPSDNSSWNDLDIIYISPGVPHSHKIFGIAKRNNIKISSDIELFLELNKNSKIVSVTGTNGKSTTTALIAHILAHAGLNFECGGNIGLPVLELPRNAKGYVLELSSFQLDLLDQFNPDISVLINITPDHLDRYDSFDDYCSSKARAFEGDGIKVIGLDSEKSKLLFDTLKQAGDKKLIPFSTRTNIKNGITCNENTIHDNYFNNGKYQTGFLQNLQGKHNNENIAAAFAVCRSLGLNAKEIIDHITTFPGLKHRMQYVGTKGHFSFYNDSKATNAAAAAASLSSLGNILWLVGGIFKEENLSPIEPYLSNITKAFLFGRDKLILAKLLDIYKVKYTICDNMDQAFEYAISEKAESKREYNILLAPACASYDQFKNFEDRGDKFVELYDTKQIN
ncbi:MAG: UDP-N-acetylmuramoyl-L-alanine--D-glutamate ligase [Rickettsiales bacterium]|nr:UDP-N-acetylmuramoyl-L-alanine--D-glutamate ligase [Rickettsiales bacterium]MCA0254464.1 UDP-N-acetylmuramoyl-L-alanine--D-glutamate ligase [Pseudomonadota bacterium]